MKSASSKVTSKGQVVIPKWLRDKYGIHPATKVRWLEREEGILLIPESEDPIIAARGMLKGTGILKAYQREKKLEKEREKRKLDRGRKFRTG
ncbi:MAG: AbrB/MazE/SpoVT family DNA-binding domain-containing protein [Deltaproteobacteria bacterium]|nr:AbrB/MazE/SpoVT family DNA-binding domain-containing protein [Deltaproteobacteria bacterium]